MPLPEILTHLQPARLLNTLCQGRKTLQTLQDWVGSAFFLSSAALAGYTIFKSLCDVGPRKTLFRLKTYITASLDDIRQKLKDYELKAYKKDFQTSLDHWDTLQDKERWLTGQLSQFDQARLKQLGALEKNGQLRPGATAMYQSWIDGQLIKFLDKSSPDTVAQYRDEFIPHLYPLAMEMNALAKQNQKLDQLKTLRGPYFDQLMVLKPFWGKQQANGDTAGPNPFQGFRYQGPGLPPYWKPQSFAPSGSNF